MIYRIRFHRYLGHAGRPAVRRPVHAVRRLPVPVRTSDHEILGRLGGHPLLVDRPQVIHQRVPLSQLIQLILAVILPPVCAR